MWQNDESKVTQAVNHICLLGGYENQGSVGVGIMRDSPAFSILMCIFFFYIFICIGYIHYLDFIVSAGLLPFPQLPVWKKGGGRARERERERKIC